MHTIKTWKWRLAAAAAGIAFAGAPVAHAAICGDSDNSGAVAINDVVLHLRVVAGIDLPGSICGGAGYANCANLNGDNAGTNDTADTVLLLRKASGVVNCPSDTCAAQTTLSCSGPTTIPNPVTGNLFIPKTCDARLDGLTFVNSGAVLTIEAGATIKGEIRDPASALIVKPGGRINAVGNVANVITWTSAASPGSRQRQDWGGVNLLGRAPVNQPNPTLEGITPSPDTIYGGSIDNDFSGCMSFNRVEFAGRELSTDNELNSLTLCGVGNKTQIDHIQSHFGFDDAFEWFGGTVNGSFLLASACGDDCFDSQLGYVGALQFGIAVDQAEALETPGSNGIEMDNSEFNAGNTPFNNPKFCNLTVIGTRYSAANPTTTNSLGILNRRGNAMTIANSIFTHWRQAGYTLRDAPTSTHACTNATTLNTVAPIGQIINSIFEDNGSGGTTHAVNDAATCNGGGSGGCTCSATEHFAALQASKGVITTTDAGIDNIGGKTFPPATFKPSGGGGSLTATATRADCTTISSFFVNAPYVGAVDPNGSDWTSGWTSYPAN